MKPPRKADLARQATASGREAYAETVYIPNTVIAVIAKAAADGFSTVRIPVDRPVPIKESKAAKRLAAALEKEGFRVSFQPRMVRPENNPTGEEASCWDVVVSWEEGGLE
jgi:hypothetical protein